MILILDVKTKKKMILKIELLKSEEGCLFSENTKMGIFLSESCQRQ